MIREQARGHVDVEHLPRALVQVDSVPEQVEALVTSRQPVEDVLDLLEVGVAPMIQVDVDRVLETVHEVQEGGLVLHLHQVEEERQLEVVRVLRLQELLDRCDVRGCFLEVLRQVDPRSFLVHDLGDDDRRRVLQRGILLQLVHLLLILLQLFGRLPELSARENSALEVHDLTAWRVVPVHEVLERDDFEERREELEDVQLHALILVGICEDHKPVVLCSLLEVLRGTCRHLDVQVDLVDVDLVCSGTQLRAGRLRLESDRSCELHDLRAAWHVQQARGIAFDERLESVLSVLDRLLGFLELAWELLLNAGESEREDAVVGGEEL